MFTFDLWAMFRAKQEEGRRWSLGSIWIFFLSFLITFGRNIVLHLPVITSFVALGQIFKLRLFLGRHGLPSLRTFLRELGEVDRRVGMLLLVLLSAGLHEEGVRGHLAPRLVGVPLAHDDGAASTWRELFPQTSTERLPSPSSGENWFIQVFLHSSIVKTVECTDPQFVFGPHIGEPTCLLPVLLGNLDHNLLDKFLSDLISSPAFL